MTQEQIDLIRDMWLSSEDAPDIAELSLKFPLVDWEDVLYTKCQTCGVNTGWTYTTYCREHIPPSNGNSFIQMGVFNEILKDVFEKGVSEGINNRNPLSEIMKK